MGAYDFSEPGSIEHLLRDVLPWIKYGNSPDDPSTESERWDALRETIMGGGGRKKFLQIDVC